MRLEMFLNKIRSKVQTPMVVYGLCDTIQTSNDGNIVERLRQVEEVSRYEPIVYDGGTIVCPIINGSYTASTMSSYTVPIRLIVITDRYDVLEDILSTIDSYETKEVRIDRSSQTIYYNYFLPSDNLVFDKFALTLDIDVKAVGNNPFPTLC